MDLDVEQMVFTSAIFRNTNVAEIARVMGMTPSNMYKKIQRNTLKAGELSKIAKALGGEYVFYFSFPNGTKIGKLERPKFNDKKSKISNVKIRKVPSPAV